MSYLKSLSLGRESKKIISTIGENGKDITNNLRGVNGDFYKKEILNYIKNDYDAKKDGKERFAKVVRVLSFEVDNTPQYQKLFLQILAKNPEFAQDILPVLDKKSLSDDEQNILDLNTLAASKVINKRKYFEIIDEIINKNLSEEELHGNKLHEVIFSSLENYGKEDATNIDMVHAYLTNPKISEEKLNNIIGLWSNKANNTSKVNNLTYDEQNKAFFDCVQIEFFRRRKKEDRMSPQVRAYLIASLNDDSKMRVNKEVAEEALYEVIDIYKKNPEIKLAAYVSISNIIKHPNSNEFMNNVLKYSAEYPDLTVELLEDVNNHPRKYTADNLSYLPFLAEYHHQNKDDYVAIAAKAIRNSRYDDEISPIFYEKNSIVNQKKEDTIVDIFNDNYKYLAYVAFNDSKMSASAALDLSHSILENLTEGFLPFDDDSNSGGGYYGGSDDDDDDDDSFIDSDKKKLYQYIADYLNIIDNSSILRDNKECHTRFVASIKAGELTGIMPDEINQAFNNIYEKNIKKLDPANFIDEILYAQKDYVKAYINNDEKILVHNIREKTFDSIENYVKRIKFTPDELESTLAALAEHKTWADNSSLKRYDKIIASLSYKKSAINPIDKFIKDSLGSSR